MAVASPPAGAAANTVEVELVIGGMTWARSGAGAGQAAEGTGVTATVNVSTERAYVTAPAQLPAPDLIGVVEAAGYTAGLASPGEADDGAAAEEAVVRRLRRRLTLALVSSSR